MPTAQNMGVSQKVAVADPRYPDRFIRPNADGSINVTGSFSAETAGVATVAAPAYVEGTENPLSLDLTGNLRVVVAGGGGSFEALVDTTPPSYVDGASEPLSMTEDGGVRTTLTFGGADFDPSEPSSVQGVTAADSPLTVAPVTTGGLAKTANPTAVSDGDVVNDLHDKLGKRVGVGSLRELRVRQRTVITSSTSETTILTAGAAGVVHDVYRLIIANRSATATDVDIRDATAGSVIGTYSVPAGATAGFSVPSGDGEPQTTAANNWTAQCADAVDNIAITVLAVKNT